MYLVAWNGTISTYIFKIEVIKLILTYVIFLFFLLLLVAKILPSISAGVASNVPVLVAAILETPTVSLGTYLKEHVVVCKRRAFPRKLSSSPALTSTLNTPLSD